jgi:uncharacterized protein YhjY with autotransporter beta-barrel domain
MRQTMAARRLGTFAPLGDLAMTKTHVRATLLATTAALTIIANAGAAPNVVLDPGFESGAFGTWVSGGSGFNSISNGAPNSGTYHFNGGCVGGGCVVVGGTGVSGPGSITQTINLAPGIYQGSFFYQTGGELNNQLAVSLGNNTVINSSNLIAAPYTEFSFISAASGGPTNLAFGIRNDPDFDQIDDVSLVMVDDGEGNNIAAASQTVALQASREFLDRLHDRFGHSGSPIATASIGESVVADASGSSYVNAGGKYRAFLSVFGSQGDWDDSSTEADRQGLSAGFEFVAGRGLDLGLAVSFSRVEFTTSTVFTANDGEADEYLGAIYAHWSAPSMPLYATGIVGYGQSSNDFRRMSLVGLGAVFASDIDAEQWFASAEIGWDWMVSQRLTLTPFARGDFANLDHDGYAETPVGGALLVPAVVAGRDVDATRSIVGLRGELDLNIGRGAKLGGKVGWAHDFDQDRFVTFTETTGPVSFAGIASAATPAEDSVVVGASFEIAVSERASFYAGYNGDIADEQDIHAGEVGLRVTW